ncbi:MAG TPA: Nudix family hydrolase [Burkholderiales bacterium]
MPERAHTPIHVAAGVLIEQGRVCVTRRRPDAPQGGKWEFPGGKLEPGETPLAGLRRELHEELGIEVEQARPLVKLVHRYPDVEVLLDVWTVTRYRGTPHGREAQPLDWVALEALDPRDFPEADRPVLRRLQLPPLYAVSDAARLGLDEFARRLARALEAGVRLVQLREPHLPRADFCRYARRLAALCRAAGARLLVNADPSWVAECDADGVHLSARRLMAATGRPLGLDRLVAASCHDAAELTRMQSLNLDFAVLGPVQPTASHPGAATLGWTRFAQLSGATPAPVYAIGGLRPADVARARAAGAQGVAMIRGLWDAADPGAAVREALAAACSG